MSSAKCNLNSIYSSKFKVAVVGCGNVGATVAYRLLLQGHMTELTLIDHAHEKAEGLMMDFEHTLSFLPYAKINSSTEMSACKDANVVIVTAGARQAEGETRLQLIQKNRAIFKDIIPKIAKAAPKALMIIITNPVDVLTYEAIKLANLSEGQVFGTGTMLDTARFKFQIAEKLCLNPESINAYILGEHGDTSFPVLSSANVGGKPLLGFDEFNEKSAQECYEDTKNAAYRIIHDIGYTCYSIANVVGEIIKHIYQHSRVILPLSVPLKNYYGISDVALSVPCVLSSSGIEETIEIPLNEKEKADLHKSADALKKLLK